jgi:oligopeptide/dipeptide ABC transporter ATP-binding protein
MVFQEPRSSLNPVLTVGSQLVDAIRAHQRTGRAEAKARAQVLLASLGMPDPGFQMRRFPLELSGGMCQRIGLALAICNDPSLVVADEPTSSLDPTIQRQVLQLLTAMNRERRIALLLISHDLAIVAEYAQRVLVMYGGTIVESGPAAGVIGRARHPYTRGLLAAMPDLGPQRRALNAIPGYPPVRGTEFPGCPFAPRCAVADPDCAVSLPACVDDGKGHSTACFRAECE